MIVWNHLINLKIKSQNNNKIKKYIKILQIIRLIIQILATINKKIMINKNSTEKNLKININIQIIQMMEAAKINQIYLTTIN